MEDQSSIDTADWDIYVPLIGDAGNDAGNDAGFRMRNAYGGTERILTTGYGRKAADSIVIGRLYLVVNGHMRNEENPTTTLIVFEWLLRPGPCYDASTKLILKLYLPYKISVLVYFLVIT